jgi:hypothetical protein
MSVFKCQLPTDIRYCSGNINDLKKYKEYNEGGLEFPVIYFNPQQAKNNGNNYANIILTSGMGEILSPFYQCIYDIQ